MTDDLNYLRSEVERLRAALDTEKEANATGWRMVEAKTDEFERLRAALTDVSFRCERCGLDFAADGIDTKLRSVLTGAEYEDVSTLIDHECKEMGRRIQALRAQVHEV